MSTVSVFELEEYQKLMETLGLNNDSVDVSDDVDYFNAWNFGQTKEDFNYAFSSNIEV